MIESQPLGGSITVTLVQNYTTARRKMLGARVPDIGFRRPEAVPIGSSFRTRRLDRHQVISDATDARLGQQVLQQHFRQFVGPLAEVMVPKLPLAMNKKERRPKVVLDPTQNPKDVINPNRKS